MLVVNPKNVPQLETLLADNPKSVIVADKRWPKALPLSHLEVLQQILIYRNSLSANLGFEYLQI
jgi:hypothetical protein